VVTGDSGDIAEHLPKFCEDSLYRLGTDYIDLYQFHFGEYPIEKAYQVRDILENLVAEGKIRCYGWSTDHVEYARVFAEGIHCAAIQFGLNLLADSPEPLAFCDEFELAGIVRNPLQKGLLTGKITPDSTFPEDDIRHKWDLRSEKFTIDLANLEKIRAILMRENRTLAQGALGWIWKRHHRTIPIPGFKTVAQVEENAGALDRGPLSEEDMGEIEVALGHRKE